MADEITTAIEGLTRRLHAYRVFESFKRGEIPMPIKWNITGKAMKARGIMDQISSEYDGLINDGSEHLGDVKGLRTQVTEMKDDLYSAANVMGNGSGNGSQEPEKPVQPPPETQVIAPAEVGKLADVLPEVGQTAAPTFPSN